MCASGRAVCAGELCAVRWLVGLARSNVALALQVAITSPTRSPSDSGCAAGARGRGGAALAAVVAEAVGTLSGLVAALRIVGARMPMSGPLRSRRLSPPALVNRDSSIRTALLIGAWAFLPQAHARAIVVLRRARYCTISCWSARFSSTDFALAARATVRPRDRRAQRRRILARGEIVTDGLCFRCRDDAAHSLARRG